MKDDSSSMSQEIESDENSSSQSEELEGEAEAEAEVSNNQMAPSKTTEYERQRMKRIEENRARMEAMGLKKMASSLVDSAPKPPKRKADKKGKRKVDDDEDYMPSSSGEEDEKNVEDQEEYSGGSIPKKKTKKNNVTTKKASSVKHFDKSDFVDDDEALLQAIALSLQDSAGFQDTNFQGSQSSNTLAVDRMSSERKEKSHNQENTGKQKKRKMMNSRVQMTEDDLILYFFQLDEAGKEGITIRDVRRMAASHDFTWSDKEIADMIKFFDSDADGKLNLDDFRKIAMRCNMLRAS